MASSSTADLFSVKGMVAVVCCFYTFLTAYRLQFIGARHDSMCAHTYRLVVWASPDLAVPRNNSLAVHISWSLITASRKQAHIHTSWTWVMLIHLIQCQVTGGGTGKSLLKPRLSSHNRGLEYS